MNNDNKVIPKLKEVDKCSRCGACIAICPQKAISKKIIEGGQWIPYIDSKKCIGCRKCEKVCIWEKGIDKKTKKSYVALNSDIYYRHLSASGGAFSAIASCFLNQGGIVCGAELIFSNGEPVIQHVLINDVSELYRILQSKYVQSDATVVFSSIKRLLSCNKRVLFSGTSCQVNSLLAFLDIENVNTNNLYTIDLICHGTPPAELFRNYISLINSKYKGKVQSFSFRLKKDGQISYTETINIKQSNKNIIVNVPWRKSSYYSMFLGEESYNHGCYSCQYSSVDKPSDITLGDYFELRHDNEELYNTIETKDGVSALIIHTDKGENLLKSADECIKTYECDLEQLVASHGNLRRPSNYSLLRTIAFSLYDRFGYKSVDLFFGIREKLIYIPRNVLHKIRKL